MVKQRVVLPETREALMNLFPAAFENQEYLRFLEYLLFSTFRDKDDDDFVVVDAATLARLQGKEKVHQNGKYKAMDFLKAFQHDVMPLELQDYRFTEGQARVARRPSGGLLGKALQQEFTSSRTERKERGIYLLTGKRSPSQTPRKQATAQKAARQAQINGIQHSVPADYPAADWLSFLNTQSDRALRKIIYQNLESARQAVLDSKNLSSSAKAYNLRVLHDIEDAPLPLYQLSKKGRTVRLFPVGSTYLGLSREIKQVLLAGTIQFDLSAAQLTLASHVWGVESLREQVLQDKILQDPWKLLARRAGFDVSPHRPPPPQKDAIKAATYTLLFGGELETVKKALTTSRAGAPALTEEQATQFLNSDVVQDIIHAQQSRQEQYRVHGGFTDVFGKWIPYKADKSGKAARSLMAQELQAYELSVMKPGLDYLMELGTEEVTVMAWQHDGLTVHFKDRSKADGRTDELNRRVEYHAVKVMGIPWWQFKFVKEVATSPQHPTTIGA